MEDEADGARAGVEVRAETEPERGSAVAVGRTEAFAARVEVERLGAEGAGAARPLPHSLRRSAARREKLVRRLAVARVTAAEATKTSGRRPEPRGVAEATAAGGGSGSEPADRDQAGALEVTETREKRKLPWPDRSAEHDPGSTLPIEAIGLAVPERYSGQIRGDRARGAGRRRGIVETEELLRVELVR